jgi:hypothetical protein
MVGQKSVSRAVFSGKRIPGIMVRSGEEQSLSDDEKTFGRYLGYVAAIAGILAVVVPATLWVASHVHRSNAEATPSGSTPAQGPSASITGTGHGQSARQVLLSSLSPEKGAQYLDGLPRALADQAGYADAVALPCPTNDLGEKSRAVTYALNGRYLSMHVELRPYRSTTDESQVQYKFFTDNDVPKVALLEVNTTQSLDLDLEKAGKLTIEIACQPPGSLAVLTNAYLEHT